MKQRAEPTVLQKQVIDTYYSNGCDALGAYCTVKKIKEPKVDKDRRRIQNNVSNMLQVNKIYITQIEKKFEKKTEKMKDKLISNIESVADRYFDLLNLAMSDTPLTEEQEKKFNRLKSIMTTADFNRMMDTLAKLTGSYEAEKHEVTQTWVAGFGGDPILPENNTIDIEHEEED